MIPRKYTALFPFGGIGGGALGFGQAEARLFANSARFEVLGGIDSDDAACKDFLYLTGAPSLCAEIEKLTAADLRSFAGPRAPDVVFLSPPCVGASGLLSNARSREPKYRALNGLTLTWLRLMLATWDEPPRLVLLENVPRLQTRAAEMLEKVRAMLRRAGYLLHEGFHDCGSIGGLAQHRRRFLLVARHARRVPPLLYQPPPRRVRACGEILGELPMPMDRSAGPMHRLPRISWLNWVRLALIPAGGDWRDLPGVLEEGQERRSKFKRTAVERWDEPVGTIGGPGSNGVENVADPRIGLGACKPSSHHNKYRVEGWGAPAHTVIGATRPGSGAPSVADPRVKTAFDHGYGVLRWDAPSFTVAAGSHPGQGAYAVADPRVDCAPRAGAYGVLSWEEAAKTITGHAKIDNGTFAVADPRKPPAHAPLIVAADGTWHRPLTTLELAALQGLPTTMPDGAPLKLHGSSTRAHRGRIGNCVPAPAAKAIAEQMLITLLQADAEAFALSSSGAVWVEPEART